MQGLNAFGAILGTILICVFWLGSLPPCEIPTLPLPSGLTVKTTLIAFSLYYYDSLAKSFDVLPKTTSTPSPFQSQLGSEPDLAKAIALICISQFLIWVLPTLSLILPRLSQPGWHLIPFVGLCDAILILASLVIVTAQVSFQIRLMRAMR